MGGTGEEASFLNDIVEGRLEGGPSSLPFPWFVMGILGLCPTGPSTLLRRPFSLGGRACQLLSRDPPLASFRAQHRLLSLEAPLPSSPGPSLGFSNSTRPKPGCPSPMQACGPPPRLSLPQEAPALSFQVFRPKLLLIPAPLLTSTQAVSTSRHVLSRCPSLAHLPILSAAADEPFK